MLDGRDLQMLSDLLDQKLKPIQEDISELKEDVGVLKTEMKEVKEDIAELKEDVGVLKVEMKEVKEDIAELKEDVSVLKEDVSVLKEDVNDLETGMKKMREDLRNLRIDHSRLEEKLDTYYARIEKTYVTEKEKRTVYQKKLSHAVEMLLYRAEAVCPIHPWLAKYCAVQIA